MDDSMNEARMSPIFPILALSAGLAAAGLLSGCGDEAAEAGAAQPATIVITARVAPVEWRDTIEALGTARANESVTLTAKVSETVRKVGFDSGDIVRAGDVIVDLSSGVQLAGLEEARASFQEAERAARARPGARADQGHLREPARHAALDARRGEGAHGRRARPALRPRDHGAVRRDPRPPARQPGFAGDAGHRDRDARRHLRHQARLLRARALPRPACTGSGHRRAQRDLSGPRLRRQGRERRFARRPGHALGHRAGRNSRTSSAC